MAFRQGSGTVSPGLLNGDHMRSAWGHEVDVESNASCSSSSSVRQGDAGGKISALKTARAKKASRKTRQCSAGWYLAILLCVVGFTFLGSDYIGRALVAVPGDLGSSKDDFFHHLDRKGARARTNRRRRGEPEVHFGQGFLGREGARDSRDWDTDDRNRDIEGSFEEEYVRLQQELQKNQLEKQESDLQADDALELPEEHVPENVSKIPGLSYERGRKELRMYEKQYEDDLLRESNSTETDNDSEEVEDEYDGEQENESTGVRRAGKSMPVQEVNLEKSEEKLPKRRRHRGACEISFANSSKIQEPDNSLKFAQFKLEYVLKEEKPADDDNWEPRFAGHQTLTERERSFRATNQTIHCGFVQGPEPFESTGFDISEKDQEYLATCQVAVSSCIFGKSDQLHSPRKRKVSGSLKKDVCFVLFVDQISLDVMTEEGHVPAENGFIGLWRVVRVMNLPYADFRRVGKIPKFLSHRLFPSARYSIWLDSKLRLQSDPLSILDYFLWRGNHEYAISNHYDRHCVWDEVQQNKRLNKYNHSLIDEQFLYYQQDGLTKFNASDPKRLLPSNVPEGSFIVRAHTPMSNLFSCLWFNEIDRFTPRDQLSFAYTYMKLVRSNPGVRFRLTMFKDCERKMITKLYRHRQGDRVSVQ